MCLGSIVDVDGVKKELYEIIFKKIYEDIYSFGVRVFSNGIIY